MKTLLRALVLVFVATSCFAQDTARLDEIVQTKTMVGVPQHKEITVPVSTLSKYTGTFQMGPNVDLSITLEGDHLMGQMSGQPKFPIFAETETLFFFKVVEATLEFQTDGSGAVTGVRLRQGPINQLLPRK